MVYIVSECCPVGCGCPVILITCRADGRIWSWCDACDCAWEHPSQARFESGLNAIQEPTAFTKGGVVFPTSDEVERAGLSSYVISTAPDSEFQENLNSLNNARTI
jgi:hypothetical protein